MEEGTKAKKTVFVGGIGDDIDEQAIYESFSTFGKRDCFECSLRADTRSGDILEVQIPPQQTPSAYQQDMRMFFMQFFRYEIL